MDRKGSCIKSKEKGLKRKLVYKCHKVSSPYHIKQIQLYLKELCHEIYKKSDNELSET